MIRQKITIFLLTILFAGSLYSQDVLNEFVIKKDDSPHVFYKSKGCTPNDGVIVFNTTIPNIVFKMPDTPNRMRNKPVFDKDNNRYVLCLQPTDTKIGGITKYSIDITAIGYKNTIIDVQEVRAEQPPQCFTIDPKIVNNTNIANSAEITVVDITDKKPISHARIAIVGERDTLRTDNKGFIKIDFNNADETTILVWHRNISKAKKVKIKPGRPNEPIQIEREPSTVQPPQTHVKVIVYDKDRNTLGYCHIKNSDGKDECMTIADGSCLIELPTTGKKTISFSHYDYTDTYTREIKAGDKSIEPVQFKNKRGTDPIDNFTKKKHANYLAWGILNTGFPLTLGTSIVGRHGVAYDGKLGIGWYATFGTDIGGNATYDETEFIAPLHWSLGIKVLYKDAFISGGYGTLGCKKMTASYDTNSGRWNSEGWRQGQGLIFTAGYDVLGDLSKAGVFFSPSIGFSYDSHADEKNKLQFLLNIKFGFGKSLK